MRTVSAIIQADGFLRSFSTRQQAMAEFYGDGFRGRGVHFTASALLRRFEPKPGCAAGDYLLLWDMFALELGEPVNKEATAMIGDHGGPGKDGIIVHGDALLVHVNALIDPLEGGA